MKVLDIEAPGAIGVGLDAIHERPIVVQLPTVFVLLAAPSGRGARQLDDTKTRLAGKNYGTAIGSLHRFLAQAVAADMPQEFNSAEHFEPLTGTFIRLRFRAPTFQSPTIRDGSHQGVLLDGVHRQLFREIEASFLSARADPIWDGDNYSAPLCTSCNESGHPDGSIVKREIALDFAEAHDIRVVLTCGSTATELGSYPIFGFERDRVSVHRDGPGLATFKARIPERLRGW